MASLKAQLVGQKESASAAAAAAAAVANATAAAHAEAATGIRSPMAEPPTPTPAAPSTSTSTTVIDAATAAAFHAGAAAAAAYNAGVASIGLSASSSAPHQHPVIGAASPYIRKVSSSGDEGGAAGATTDDDDNQLLISDLAEDDGWLRSRPIMSPSRGAGGGQHQRFPPREDPANALNVDHGTSVHRGRYSEPRLALEVANMREQFMRSKNTLVSLISELNASLAGGAQHEIVYKRMVKQVNDGEKRVAPSPNSEWRLQQSRTQLDRESLVRICTEQKK